MFTSPFSSVTHSAIYRRSIQHAHKACGEYCFCYQLMWRNRSTWSEIINWLHPAHTSDPTPLLPMPAKIQGCLSRIWYCSLVSPVSLCSALEGHSAWTNGLSFLSGFLFSICQCHILKLQFLKSFHEPETEQINGDHWTLMCLSAQRAPLFHQSLISL